MIRGVVACGAVAGAVCAPGVAHALEPEITADTAAQFYDVRSPTGETIIARRRLTTAVLGLRFTEKRKPQTESTPSG